MRRINALDTRGWRVGDEGMALGRPRPSPSGASPSAPGPSPPTRGDVSRAPGDAAALTGLAIHASAPLTGVSGARVRVQTHTRPGLCREPTDLEASVPQAGSGPARAEKPSEIPLLLDNMGPARAVGNETLLHFAQA